MAFNIIFLLLSVNPPTCEVSCTPKTKLRHQYLSHIVSTVPLMPSTLGTHLSLTFGQVICLANEKVASVTPRLEK